MNCTDFERLIALDVEGDLPEPKGRAVTEHLQACHSCRQFAERLKFSQELLKDLGQEPVDEQMVQEVRTRVRSGLESETQPQGFHVWRLALGAGLIAALIVAGLTLRHHSGGAVTQVVAERSTPVKTALPLAVIKGETQVLHVEPRSAKSARAARVSSDNASGSARQNPISTAPSVARKPNSAQGVPPSTFSSGSLLANVNAQHPQPLTVKLITDNPNVVIYWLVD